MSSKREAVQTTSMREDLRALVRKWGTPALIAGITELLRELATAGAAAELAKRRAKDAAAETCPRCLERDAIVEETKRILKRASKTPPQGRLPEPVPEPSR